MTKRTVVIIVVAAAILAALAALVVILVGIYGGTPIIIKGFGDTDGDLAIAGSPSQDSTAPTTAGKKHHTRVKESIDNLYVRRGDGTCVTYQFGTGSEPRIKIDVSGVSEEIDLMYTQSTTILDLMFDDINTYDKSGDYYTRKQKARIDRVRVITAPNSAKCTNEGGGSISPCPTEVSGTGQLTIAVNYGGKACQQ